MQRFIDLISSELKNVTGAVFNSGKAAFSQPGTGLYLLGLNPGGQPEKHLAETVKAHSHKVLCKKDNWCAHRDECWEGRPAGTWRMQPHVLHVLHQLGLDPGLVPSSNIIFKRTQDQAALGTRWRELAWQCWPMHAAVIKELEIRTIVCFGQVAGRFVRHQLGAHRRLGAYVETNNRRLVTEAFESIDGTAVIVATHPSRFAWNSPNADPSDFFRAVMQRQDGQLLETHSPDDVAAALKAKRASRAKAVAAPSRSLQTSAKVLSSTERDARLSAAFVASGLSAILDKEHKQGKDQSFSKLFVLPNDFGIRSIELYSNGAGKFRVHHAANAPEWFRKALRRLPNAKNPGRVGTDFDGDALSSAKALAGVLSAGRGSNF